jgi:hypothetical protein
MSTSAQSAVEDALLAALQADGTLAAIAGPPQLFEPSDPLDEHVWIAEDAELTQDVHTTGNVPTRQEDFTIRVVVFVVMTGNDYAAVRNRGVELVAAVENVVRTNFTLTGSAFFADVSSIRRTSAGWDKRRGVVHEVAIRCRTYI